MAGAPGSHAAPNPAPFTKNDAGQVVLTASRHRTSEKYYFPVLPDSIPVARDCETVTLSPEATLYSFTVVHPSPKSGQPPFILAYADFPERVRVLGRLKLPDGARPGIGARLRLELDATAGGEPTYVFVPVQ